MRLAVYTDAVLIGGAETVLGHLLSELDPSIDVTVLGVDRTVVARVTAARPGAAGLIVPAPQNKLDLRPMAATATAIRRLSPEILHVNLHSPWAGQYGILGGLLARCRVVAVEHSVYRSRSPLQRRLRRSLCRHLAAHVAVGENAAREIEALIGLRPGSVETIYDGIPDLPPRATPRLASAPVIGAIARIAPEKGLDVLIRALALLADEVTCVVIGDGPDRAELEGLAEALGVADRLIVTGWVDNPRDYLAALDVIVLPSRLESLSLVAIEAMFAARPVVATSIQGVPEVVEDGVTGVLVPPDAPPALAEAIATLLDDPDLRSSLGDRGRRRALERFTSQTMARSYEQLYERVLET